MALTPSQRADLIREIGLRLGTESWPLIDITLSQFSFPTSDEWQGEKENYVFAMIKNGQDESLVELARHVGYDFAESEPFRVDPSYRHKGFLRLFISHLATHRVFAGELRGALLEFGISSFVAHDDIEPTLDWQTQIETALATCDTLVALLHDEFHESNWTDQEIGFAMGRGVPAYSVRFGQTPYGFIGRFQAFNGNGKNPRELAREMFECFRKNKQTQRKTAQALVALFEDSGSFADAKKRMAFLEELDYWETSFSSRIRSAAKENGQIAHSYGVPERIEALLKKRSQK